jgi:trans-2-decenoyl-[acyl-carrier protein] isomerase
MAFEKLQVSVADGIATVAMDCPKNLNAMDEIMIGELIDAFHECDNNPDVRVIVLSSTGRAFCGGGDINFMYQGIKKGKGINTDNLGLAADVSKTMKQVSKPIIGSVNGAAAGGGFIIALACDYVIASTDAKFLAAFVNIGLVPDSGGLYIMTRSLGVNKALELALSGRIVPADEAKNLGFVAEIVPTEELQAATTKTAKNFASGPALAYAKIKELLWTAAYSGYEEYVGSEIDAQLACTATEDFKQRVIAFVEKK